MYFSNERGSTDEQKQGKKNLAPLLLFHKFPSFHTVVQCTTCSFVGFWLNKGCIVIVITLQPIVKVIIAVIIDLFRSH